MTSPRPIGHDRVIFNVDRGLEPVPVPLLDLAQRHLTFLRNEFRYISDSVLPDSTPLSDAEPPVSAASAADSDQDGDLSDGDDDWACGCAREIDACSAAQSDICDCVSSFGNFYATTPAGHRALLLNALPDGLPLVECGPSCACGSSCVNRLTQLGIRQPLAVEATATGLGAFYSPCDSTSLPAGSFICLYAGEYLTTSQARERWARGYDDNYTLSLRVGDDTVHIDPRYRGNVGRFLNHSCDPNCVIQIVRWGGGHTWSRAAIFTKRLVRSGEELTFDYGNASGSRAGRARVVGVKLGETRCLCGTTSCRGYMPYDETL